MESSGSGGDDGGVIGTIQRAVDDLRSAGDEASSEVRTRIESALRELQDATEQARGRASEQASSARGQVEELLETIRTAGSDLLEQIQAEIDKRRAQLGLGGDSTASDTDTTAGTTDT